MGRSSEAKDRKKQKRVKCDRWNDGQTNRQTDKAGCRVAWHATNKGKEKDKVECLKLRAI